MVSSYILGYDPIWRSGDDARFQSKHFRWLKEAGSDSVRNDLHPFGHTKGAPGFTITHRWFEPLDWDVARTAESMGWSWASLQFDSDTILYDIDRDAWVQPICNSLAPSDDRELELGICQGKPFQNNIQEILGRLECEFYDEGGVGGAYHETEGRNHGSGEVNRGDYRGYLPVERLPVDGKESEYGAIASVPELVKSLRNALNEDTNPSQE